MRPQAAACSLRRRLKFVNCKLRRLFHKRGARPEPLGKLAIVFQPPLRAGIENEMGRAALPQLLQVGDHLRAIEWVPLVNSVLEKVPTLSMRVIENGRIAIVRCDDQRVASCRLPQFESEISQAGGGWPVKSLHA